MARLRYDQMRTVAFGAITASYAALGTPIDFSYRMFKITNNTDGDMLFSFNGTNDNMFVPAFSFTLYDIATNAPNVGQNDELVLDPTTQFYIKYSTAPSMGAVWVEGAYIKYNTGR